MNKKNLAKLNIAISFINILFALYITFNNSLQLELIKIILTLVIAVQTILIIIKILANNQKVELLNRITITYAFISIAILIFDPFSIHNLFFIIFSSWIVLTGINKIIKGFKSKKAKNPTGIIVLVFGIVETLLGLTLLSNQLSSNIFYNQTIGLFIIATTIINISVEHLEYKELKDS